MANTYSQTYYHIVYSVENRQSLLTNDKMIYISKYIWGIIKSLEGMPFVINGYKDHIHILTSIPLTMSVSDFVRTIKSRSSKHVNEKNLFFGRFGWQNGYGVFTVSQSMLKTVIDYIVNQEEHHQKISFEQEYKSFLKAHHIEYNDKYLFKLIDE